MRTCCFTGVAAIALALGVTAGVQAAGVQNVESQRDTARGAQNQQGAQQQNAPAPSAQSRQNVQAPQGGDKQEAAGNEQPDRSGLIALDEREQTRIGNIVRQQRIQAVTNVNFSLSVASTVPSLLIARARIGRAVQLVIATPLHLLRRGGLEDGVVMITDKLGGGIYKWRGISPQGPAVDIESLSPAYLVGDRAGTGQWQLPAEIWLGPDAREIRGGYGALRSGAGRPFGRVGCLD